MYAYQLTQQRIFDGAYAGFSLEAGHLGKPLVPSGISGTLYSGALFFGITWLFVRHLEKNEIFLRL